WDIDFTDARFLPYNIPALWCWIGAGPIPYRDRHTLSLQISNLTDENYYEKRGFNLPGRAFYLRYTLEF
ncbi:MAG: hypothetical protein HC880_17595, partial [Bacteroidia bacterium]|nr:hypothetical protein [Bacteroidia bacterium]